MQSGIGARSDLNRPSATRLGFRTGERGSLNGTSRFYGTQSGLSTSREGIGTFRRPGAGSLEHRYGGRTYGRYGGSGYYGGSWYGRYPYHGYGNRGYYGYYPYGHHHRSSIFINIGGYWPWWYVDLWPWYWYGYYPYYWYEPYPYGYWIGPGVSNYYYYNYQTPAAPPESEYGIQEPNYEAFRQARQRQEQQQQTTEQPETKTDANFDEGVKAFGQGEYNVAVERFAQAVQSAPEDTVMPFAYSQALFAAKDYHKAAQVLRSAIAGTSPETEGVFYPRGLYSSDTVLEKQISELDAAAKANPADYDLQFLLGYEQLGMNRLDEARAHLQEAQNGPVNGPAAKSLLVLIDRLEKEAGQQK
jgi:hypothetical protein